MHYFLTGDLTDNRFPISKRSSMKMQVECKDLLSESGKLHAAKIWLFPEVQKEDQEVLDITFMISLSSSTLGVIKRSRTVHTWNKKDACMALDLTSAVKKLSMHGSTEEECNLTIEVADIKPANSIDNQVHNTIEEQICLEIGDRNCKPFVVLQYIELEDYIRPRIGERIDENISRRKRHDKERQERQEQEELEEQKRREGQEDCFAADYRINLTILFPTILLPAEDINIKTCEGNCTQTSISSFRQNIFQRLMEVEEDYIDGTPCCVPAETLPLLLLVQIDRKYLLEEVPGTIIESCKCV